MNKLYVLIRRDLKSSAYQAVQAGHAVAQWLLHAPNRGEWKNETLVYTSVDNLNHLKYWQDRLKQMNIDYVTFTEPDIGNQPTALAAACDGKVFKSLRLM